MKPDGVATATMDPMETGAEALVDGPPAAGEEPAQALSPSEPGEVGEAEPRPPEDTTTAPTATKVGNDGKSGDPKAKAKGPAKARPGTTGAKAVPGSRPGTAQSRAPNGVQKPLTNGMAKKTNATAPERKKTTPAASSAPPKRPIGIAAPAKVADRKPGGAARPASSPAAASGAKAAAGTSPANKKLPAGASGDAKTKPRTAGPRPASATAAKPSPAAATKTDRVSISKTTRPATASSATCPASASTSTKTAASTAKPSPSRPGATVPSAGRTTAAQPSKSTTPLKKDVGKPATAAAKKQTPAPTRLSPTKTSKPETPKAATPAKPDSAPKKPASSGKAADAKPGRPKPAASREVSTSSRAAGTKPGAVKTPKKAVGSSTPMPVKRTPKAVTPAQPPTATAETPPAEKKASGTLAGIFTGAGAAIAAVAVAMVASEAPAETAVSPVGQEAVPSDLLGDVPAATPLSFLNDTSDIPSAPPSTLFEGILPEDPVAVPAPLLGTTVLSPPSSPPGPVLSPAQSPTCMLDLDVHEREHTPDLLSPAVAPESTAETAGNLQWEDQDRILSSTAGSAGEPMNQEVGAELQLDTATDDLIAARLLSLTQEREEAVEKADEEINEDEDDEDEDEEEREGSQPVSMSEMSGTQPTDESRAGSAGLAGSAWRTGALLSELDSEDVSGSQQGASEMSAPGLLEGTESTDDMGDASLKGAEGVSAGSPDIDTVPDIPANEEEEEDRVYDMDVSSERAEGPHRGRRDADEEEEEEEDEDVEMASEGVTESGLESYGNADEDDFPEEDRLDNLNRVSVPPVPPAGPWAQSGGPFADPWAQPPQLMPCQPLSPLSDRWSINPGMPTPPSQAWLDLGAAPLLLQPDEPLPHAAAQSPPPLPPPAVGMSQSSTLSGRELAARSSSETSTPEELRDYDSSSGVESRSEEKQDTPVPQQALPDAGEQDLGIHLERGDAEEEEEEGEAETLPADEVLGGPPTAPASATPSPSDSGDEASDMEGEMQINEPYAVPGAGRGLSALEEREEGTGAGGEAGEEDGGGTPQSANSAGSYVFDCTTTSNSNAQSVAEESCGRSPGIFSLENEDQLTEEAKDPSLIRELTLPAAAPVDLLPLDQPDDAYMLCGKQGAEPLDPLAVATAGPCHPDDAVDPQPPYYSAICDKTDNFLAGCCRGNARTAAPHPSPQQQGQCWRPLPSLESAPKPGPPPTPIPSPPCQLRRSECRIDLPPPPLPGNARLPSNTQLRRLERHQQQLRRIQLRQELERRRRQEEERWRQEEERLRQEEERRRQEEERHLLHLQLQQRAKATHLHRPQSAVQLSPSGLCTIYEAMETSEEEEEEEEDHGGARKRRGSTSIPSSPGEKATRLVPSDRALRPPSDPGWDRKLDVLQPLVNQALLLAGDGYPPLLLLPGGGGGALSPLETSAWPFLLPPLTLHSGTVTSVSSFSPEDPCGHPRGDWTVVELETHH